MSAEKESEKIYLDYLDKEMTIMGILSTFCVASILVTVNSFILPGKDCQANIFWETSPWYCSVGLAGFLGAALSFYKQRSLLAFYYGQISLNILRKKNEEVENLLNEADSWTTWNAYKSGFGFLFISFGQFAFVLIGNKTHIMDQWQPYIAMSIVLVFTLIIGIVIFACYKYPYADYPMKLLRDKSERSKYLKKHGE